MLSGKAEYGEYTAVALHSVQHSVHEICHVFTLFYQINKLFISGRRE